MFLGLSSAFVAISFRVLVGPEQHSRPYSGVRVSGACGRHKTCEMYWCYLLLHTPSLCMVRRPILKYFINGFGFAQPLKPITNPFHFVRLALPVQTHTNEHDGQTYMRFMRMCEKRNEWMRAEGTRVQMMPFIYLSFDQSVGYAVQFVYEGEIL